MGATTKSITGLFANDCGRSVCGRIVREQIAAGQGTRSAAAQGDLPLSLSRLDHHSRLGDSQQKDSWREQLASLVRFTAMLTGITQASDEARWLLKRLGGQLSSALPNMSGNLSPARCPASVMLPADGLRPQAVGRQLPGGHRFQG